MRRNVTEVRADAGPHLSGSVFPEKGGPVTGSEAGPASFSPPVMKSWRQIAGIGFARRAAAHLPQRGETHRGFTCASKCTDSPGFQSLVIMKKGPLYFLGRKNQSLFDTNVKMKEMGE